MTVKSDLLKISASTKVRLIKIETSSLKRLAGIGSNIQVVGFKQLSVMFVPATTENPVSHERLWPNNIPTPADPDPDYNTHEYSLTDNMAFTLRCSESPDF